MEETDGKRGITKKEVINILNKRFGKNNRKIENTILFEIKRIESNLQNNLDNFNNSLIKIKEETEDRMQSLLENMDFVKRIESRMVTGLNKEIRIILSNEDISKTIIEISKVELKRNLSENIKSVVSSVLSTISNKLKKDLKITKDLSYSIDLEIQHVLKNSEISHEVGKRIENRINHLLNSIIVKDGKLLLTDETNKDLVNSSNIL